MQHQPKKGDYFYLVNQYGKFLKKISWIKNQSFEWKNGFSKIESLIPNNNKKSKVKFQLIIN